MRLSKALLLSALVVVVVGAVVFYGAFSPAKTTTVLTAPVTRGNIEQTVLATGTLKPYRLVAVGSQATGRITSLKVAVGDTVKAGDLIAEIDATTQTNALRTSEASLANVKAQKVQEIAQLENAKLTLARQQAVYDKQAGSQADLQTAVAAVKVDEAQIDALDAQIVAAQVAVETAQADLGYTRIKAPMDGTVLAVVNQEGRTVNATQTAPTIVILGDLTKMTVRAEISEADITRVAPGQKIRFSLIGEPEKTYDTTLASIEPAPESITSDSSVTTSTTESSSSSSSSSSSAIYYIGVFNIDNPDGLFRTYMSAEVNIILGSAKDVLTIPSSALHDTAATGKAKLRVQKTDGTIETRTVEIGLNNKITAEVKSGVQEGEHVVIGEGSASDSSQQRRGPPRMGF